MSSCSSNCPPCPPQFFETPNNERVHGVFAAVYNATEKKWQYPVFLEKADYTGATTKTTIVLSNGKQMDAYVPNNVLSSQSKPTRFPIMVSKQCSQKCVRSSSDMLEQRKRENMLKKVQNGASDCPMQYCNYLTYMQATQLIVPHYTCTSGVNNNVGGDNRS